MDIKSYALALQVAKQSGSSGGGSGSPGKDGVTFTPAISNDGILSWTNDGELPNPEPVNITGPAGKTGERGIPGEQGLPGKSGTSIIGVIIEEVS